MKVYSVNDFEKDMRKMNFSYKKQNFKRKFQSGLKKAGEWIIRNKEFVIILVPVAVSASTALFKAVSKNVNLSKEKAVKDLYCYDRSLGHYWALRRELTNSEWVEIDKRKANGERLADILSELRVLK